MLKWKRPSGNNTGFRIEISNTSTPELVQSYMVEAIVQTFNITESLHFFSTYNVTIITLSNGGESSPVTKLCNTSITGKH